MHIYPRKSNLAFVFCCLLLVVMNTLPSSNLGQECTWSIQENTHIFGAQRELGITTLQDCINLCTVRPDCFAFDFRKSISGCYPHFNPDDSQFIAPDPDLDYYEKTSCDTGCETKHAIAHGRGQVYQSTSPETDWIVTEASSAASSSIRRSL